MEPEELRLAGGIAALRWAPVAPGGTEILAEGTSGGYRDISAKRVLAVHGRLDNAASFQFVGPLFAAAGYELVALDLPGHGRSPWKPDGLYTLVSQSCAVVLALDDLGWSSCTMLAHSLGTAYATMAVGCFPDRFSSCIFIEGFSGFGFTYGVDFGDVEPGERHVTAAPASLRKSVNRGFVALRKLGARAPKNYASVNDAVSARIGGAFKMARIGAEALVRRGGQEDEHGFHFTHDPRANVSFMLQMLTAEQGRELMEQVPRSLVLCAGESTGDTNRGASVTEVVQTLSPETGSRIEVAVVENTGHHMHCDEAARVAKICLDWLASEPTGPALPMSMRVKL